MSQHWTKVQIKGKKPAPRNYHTTLCIEDPHTGHHPLLMVVGGAGSSSILSDVCLLDVINGVWTEVCVHFLTSKFTSTCILVYLHIYSEMYGYNFRYNFRYGIVCCTL